MMLNYLQTASYLLNFIFRPRFKLFIDIDIDIDIVLDLKEVEREAENQKHLVEKKRYERNEQIKTIVLKERNRVISINHKASLLQIFFKSFLQRKRERRKKRLYYILKCYIDKRVISEKFDVWKHYLSEIRRHEEERMESILSNEKILLKKFHHERLQDTSEAIVASNKLSLLQNFVRSFIKRRRRRRKKRNKRIYHILRSYADKCYIS